MNEKTEVTITNRHRYAIHCLSRQFRSGVPRTLQLTERQLRVVRGNPWLWIDGEDWDGGEDVDLNSLNVSELKERLAAKDLSVSGRKADLVERLLSHEDEEEE